MKLLIGVPAYNEENVIGKVLKNLPRKISGISKIDILVVNDGSSDETEKLAEKISGVIVLNHLINRGLGGALKTILTYAKMKNYDLLITFDADGQHISNDVVKLINTYYSSNTDVVIGSRWKRSLHKPFSRYLVNQFANFFTFLLFAVWTSDSQSGLRLFNKKAINCIDLETDGMEVSSEIFKEIKRKKLSFSETSITAIYTKYSLKKGQQVSNSINVIIQLLLRLIK